MVVVVVRGGEGKCQTREEGFGEGELETTPQRSATLAVAAERARSYSVPQLLTIKILLNLWEHGSVAAALGWLLGGVLLGCFIDMWVKKKKKKVAGSNV